MLKITPPEYVLMKMYIEEHCGIHLDRDKEYLIESRLSDLVGETGCRSFQEFHYLARTDYTGQLKDRIVDAMTTNETSWFRDRSAWEYMEEQGIPLLIDRAAENGHAAVWSAAASTGQEIYSLMMLLDETLTRRGLTYYSDRIEVLATDISTSALAGAVRGTYDSIAISRGLPPDRKVKYFTPKGNRWEFDPALRRRVLFKKFNLQHSFVSFPPFDMILCRYVSIYFADSFKRELFAKLASVLRPGGILLLGATESLREYSDAFDITYYKSAVINIKK